MQNKKYIISILLIMFVLSSCVYRNPSDIKTSLETSSEANLETNPPTSTISNETEAKISPSDINSDKIILDNNSDGKYFYDDYSYMAGLQLINILSDTTYTICSIPGCLHNSKNCFAKKETLNRDFSTIYNNCALFYDDASNKAYFVNTDGSGLKEIEDFSSFTTPILYNKIMVNNHLYMYIHLSVSSMDDNGYFNSVSGIIRLYDFDFEKKECTILYETPKYISIHPSCSLLYSNGNLFFSYSGQTKAFEESELTEYEFYSNYDKYFHDRYEILGLVDNNILFNIETGLSKTMDLDPQLSPAAFVDNTIFLYSDDGIYTHNIDTDTTSTFISEKKYTTYLATQSADFVLISYVFRGRKEYFMIKDNSLQLLPLTHELDFDFIISDECFTQLLLQFYNGDGDFDISNTLYISRDEFKSWFS